MTVSYALLFNESTGLSCRLLSLTVVYGSLLFIYYSSIQTV